MVWSVMGNAGLGRAMLGVLRRQSQRGAHRWTPERANPVISGVPKPLPTGWSNNGYGCGVVYQLKYSSKSGWTQTVLYHFTGNNDGAGPFARLLSDAAGNLYGATAYGGGNTACSSYDSVGCGTVFELTPSGNTWTEKVVYAFSGTPDGSGPVLNGSLVMDKSGKPLRYDLRRWRIRPRNGV